VSNGGTALRAENAVDGQAGGTCACVGLGGSFDGELVLEDDSYEG
jgi:hypothetical protein